MIIAETSTMEWVSVGAIVFDTLVSGAIAVGLYKVSLAVGRHERHEQSTADKIAGLRQDLHAASERLIDERFSTVTHRVDSHAQAVIAAIDEIKLRLADGEGTFEKLAGEDHRLEMKVIAKFETLKDWMRETFAGRTDLKDHEKSVSAKFDKIDDHVGAVEKQVAVLGAEKQLKVKT